MTFHQKPIVTAVSLALLALAAPVIVHAQTAPAAQTAADAKKAEDAKKAAAAKNQSLK